MGRSPVLLAALLVILAHAPAASAAGFDVRWTSCAADGGTSNQNFRVRHRCRNAHDGDLVQARPAHHGVSSSRPCSTSSSRATRPCRHGGRSSTATSSDYRRIATIDPSAVACADWSAGLGAAVVSNMNQRRQHRPSRHRSAPPVLRARRRGRGGREPRGESGRTSCSTSCSDHTTTVDPGSCAGCSARVHRLELDPTSWTPRSLRSCWAHPRCRAATSRPGREGAGANCAAVPARKTTWGAVKSLYR